MDIPNHRSSHTTPTPRWGGIACAAGISISMAATGNLNAFPLRTIVGVTSLTGAGLVDDQLGNVSYLKRLAVQGLAGTLFSPRTALLPVAIVGTAGIVNVVNFMDGINGITGSTAAIWGILTAIAGRQEGDLLLETLGAATAGAALGFLPYNIPQAQLFLGDVGSYLFGALMSAGISRSATRPLLTWRISAPLLLYGVDASQAIIRHTVNGDSITDGHRDHVYQRLVDENGLSHVQVATLHGAAAITVAALAACRPSLISSVSIATVAAGYLLSPRILRRVVPRKTGHHSHHEKINPPTTATD